MAKSSYFISFEGVEGVGKSTAVRFLHRYLEQASISAVMTREPGGTEIAEAIRSVLLGHHAESMCCDTELLLMFAGRAQHITQVIAPALQQGQWVLTDRFTDATFAYQGGGRGIAVERIATLAAWLKPDLQPNLTFLLDAPVEIGLERIRQRGKKDRIEEEKLVFFERVRATYLALVKKQPERFCVIDATQRLDVIQQQLVAAIKPLLDV